MADVNCPYCGEEQEINHDDGYGYGEEETHHQKCGNCDKTFTFTTSIHYYYAAEKADCLNGSPHNYKNVRNNIFPYWIRCIDCGEENRGKYKEPTE